jgi:mRNA interferase MazF
VGGLKRGDLVAIAVQVDFGKSRLALAIQANQFEAHPTATVLLISRTMVDAPIFRITIQPSPKNGLQKSSQVMVHKAMTVLVDKVGATIGQLDHDSLLAVARSLAIFLGIAKWLCI